LSSINLNILKAMNLHIFQYFIFETRQDNGLMLENGCYFIKNLIKNIQKIFSGEKNAKNR